MPSNAKFIGRPQSLANIEKMSDSNATTNGQLENNISSARNSLDCTKTSHFPATSTNRDDIKNCLLASACVEHGHRSKIGRSHPDLAATPPPTRAPSLKSTLMSRRIVSTCWRVCVQLTSSLLARQILCLMLTLWTFHFAVAVVATSDKLLLPIDEDSPSTSILNAQISQHRLDVNSGRTVSIVDNIDSTAANNSSQLKLRPKRATNRLNFFRNPFHGVSRLRNRLSLPNRRNSPIIGSVPREFRPKNYARLSQFVKSQLQTLADSLNEKIQEQNRQRAMRLLNNNSTDRISTPVRNETSTSDQTDNDSSNSAITSTAGMEGNAANDTSDNPNRSLDKMSRRTDPAALNQYDRIGSRSNILKIPDKSPSSLSPTLNIIDVEPDNTKIAHNILLVKKTAKPSRNGGHVTVPVSLLTLKLPTPAPVVISSELKNFSPNQKFPTTLNVLPFSFSTQPPTSTSTTAASSDDLFFEVIPMKNNHRPSAFMSFAKWRQQNKNKLVKPSTSTTTTTAIPSSVSGSKTSSITVATEPTSAPTVSKSNQSNAGNHISPTTEATAVPIRHQHRPNHNQNQVVSSTMSVHRVTLPIKLNLPVTSSTTATSSSAVTTPTTTVATSTANPTTTTEAIQKWTSSIKFTRPTTSKFPIPQTDHNAVTTAEPSTQAQSQWATTPVPLSQDIYWNTFATESPLTTVFTTGTVTEFDLPTTPATAKVDYQPSTQSSNQNYLSNHNHNDNSNYNANATNQDVWDKTVSANPFDEPTSTATGLPTVTQSASQYDASDKQENLDNYQLNTLSYSPASTQASFLASIYQSTGFNQNSDRNDDTIVIFKNNHGRPRRPLRPTQNNNKNRYPATGKPPYSTDFTTNSLFTTRKPSIIVTNIENNRVKQPDEIKSASITILDPPFIPNSFMKLPLNTTIVHKNILVPMKEGRPKPNYPLRPTTHFPVYPVVAGVSNWQSQTTPWILPAMTTSSPDKIDEIMAAGSVNNFTFTQPEEEFSLFTTTSTTTTTSPIKINFLSTSSPYRPKPVRRTTTTTTPRPRPTQHNPAQPIPVTSSAYVNAINAPPMPVFRPAHSLELGSTSLNWLRWLNPVTKLYKLFMPASTESINYLAMFKTVIYSLMVMFVPPLALMTTLAFF